MVGGEFADEVCGEMGRISDWALSTSFLTLLGPGGCPFGPRDYLRWSKRRLLYSVRRPPLPYPELSEAIHPEIVAEYNRWIRRRQADLTQERRPLPELAIRVKTNGWVTMNWEGTTPLGVRRSLPFFTREVLELAFECHPWELVGPGPKKLLRNALRGDVPDHNLLRPDKGVVDPNERKMRTPAVPEKAFELAREVVRPDWLASRPPEISKKAAADLLRISRVAGYLQDNPG
jgi:hypothetical protein